MEKTILTQFDFNLEIGDVLRALRLNEDGEEDIAALAARLLDNSEKYARPKALFSNAETVFSDGSVTINGVKLQNAFLSERLAESSHVIPYVATCGTELEEWSDSLTDPLERYWADTIKLLYLAKARSALYSEVKRLYFPKAKNLSSLNPGSLKEWPIQGQVALFKLLGGVTPDIGVRLTESMLMLPPKTISGIYFSSEKEYENCMLCPREGCPNRRVPFAGNM